MSNRLDKESESKLQPVRIEYAIAELNKLGKATVKMDNYLMFEHNGYIVTLWPYSGWFSGRSVKDGRGIENLLKQLK